MRNVCRFALLDQRVEPELLNRPRSSIFHTINDFKHLLSRLVPKSVLRSVMESGRDSPFCVLETPFCAGRII